MKEKIESIRILPPKLPLQPELIATATWCPEDDDLQERFCMEGGRIMALEADHLTLKQAIFRNVAFQETSLRQLDLMDARFENCNLSNLDLSNAILHRVEFIDCSLVGVSLSEATCRNVLFRGCNGSYGCFRYSDLESVIFENCNLNHAEMLQARFSKVRLAGCGLIQAQLSGTALKDIDLRDNDIDGIGVRLEDLQGAIVTEAQAVMLAGKLGLVVR